MPPRGVVCGGGADAVGKFLPQPSSTLSPRSPILRLRIVHGAEGMLQSAAQKGRFLLLAGCAAALVVTAGALRADLLVSHAFDQAFGKRTIAAPFDIPLTSGAQTQSRS